MALPAGLHGSPHGHILHLPLAHAFYFSVRIYFLDGNTVLLLFAVLMLSLGGDTGPNSLDFTGPTIVCISFIEHILTCTYSVGSATPEEP